MGERRRHRRRGRRRGGDGIAADAADVAERRRHAGDAEIGRIERPGVDAEILGIDLVVRLDGLRDVVVAEARFEQGLVGQRGVPHKTDQRRPRRIGDRVEHVDGSVRRDDFAAVACGRRLIVGAEEEPFVDEIRRIELVVDLDRERRHVRHVRRADVHGAARVGGVVLEQRLARRPSRSAPAPAQSVPWSARGRHRVT